jgi:hypothetical protein
MGNMYGTDGKSTRELQVPITQHRKESNTKEKKFTEMPITDSVIKKVEEMAVKDGAVNGISFKNRKRVEYVFDNEDE